MRKSYLCAIMFLLVCCQKVEQKQEPSNCINMHFSGYPATIDPRKSGDVTASTFVFMTFEGLMQPMSDALATPALAKEMKVSDDGLTYTFFLRPSSWSDGHPVTAHDFEYSWKSSLNPNFPAPFVFMLYPIKNAKSAREGLVDPSMVGVRAVDDHTLVVELEHPNATFKHMLSFFAYFPVPKHIDQVNPNWAKAPMEQLVCNGPFKVASASFDKAIIMKKNPSFWNADRIKTEGIHISLISDGELALRMFQSGDLDLIVEPLVTIPRDAIPTLKKENAKFQPIDGTIFFAFNLEHPLFKDVDMRKAFSCAIDRQTITRDTTQSGEEPGSSLIPSCIGQYKGAYYPICAQKDKARKHFAQGLKTLGLTKDTAPRIELLHQIDQISTKVAQVIQQQINDVLGVHIQLKGADRATYFHQLQSRDYTIGLAELISPCADPTNAFDRFASSKNLKNYPGWHHPEYQKIVHTLSITEDPVKRAQLVKQAEELIAHDMPIAPIYHISVISLTQERLKGLKRSVIGHTLIRDMYIDYNP